MRIGLDGRILAHPRCGIGSYLLNLLRNFSDKDDLEFFIFTDRAIHPEYDYVSKIADVKIFGQDRRKYWAQFLLPAQLKKCGVDLYHAVWNTAVPIAASCPTVLTLHDLIPLVLPDHFSKKRKRIKFILQSFLSARRAKYIITVSNCSKKDIRKILKIPSDKIKVIYNGVEPAPEFIKEKNPFEIKECLRQFSIPEDYIINTGGFEHPRRNVDLLLRAFRIFLDRDNINVKLVIVGRAEQGNPHYLKLKDQIKNLGLEKYVIFTGIVTDFEMSILLSGARLMVFPSLYEGFGRPPLEAMACGAPVITTLAGSIPEIVNGAAILVDPRDENKLAIELSRLYFDAELQNTFRKKGLERIKDFSWQAAAEQTLKVYRMAVEN